jgi:cation diffusion facilitator family transporter
MTAENPPRHLPVLGNDRGLWLLRAWRLALVTVTWNVFEGVVAVLAAVGAGSVVLLGFGIDSFVETTSGAVALWRLRAERRAKDHEEIERVERRAGKLVAASLALLAAYVLFEAGRALWRKEQPEPTGIGIAITAVSLVVMVWLARRKREAARRLGSRALEADAFQTSACFWLSAIALGGMALNAGFGWWWADPVAACAMTPLFLKEAREAWRGGGCCD